jgi:hypothetical protein
MNTYNLSRAQAVELAGLEAVESVERENCEPTSRLLPDHMVDITEWAASVKCLAGTLSIYYMTNGSDEMIADNNGGDWGEIPWSDRIDHYSLT